MALTSDEEDFLQSIGIKCVEMCNALANQRLAFKFSLTFGRFSFNMDTTEMRSPPAQLPQKKAKRKSKSAKIRDMRRRREFLERKEAALSSSVSQAVPDIFSSVASWETGDPSQVDIPRAEAAQRHTDPKISTPRVSDYDLRNLPPECGVAHPLCPVVTVLLNLNQFLNARTAANPFC